MSSYLVTGGCGFIGSHLVDALILDQHHVLVLDNLSTGKIENLNPKAEFIQSDILEADVITKLMREVDGCFHLAAVASVIQCQQEWFRGHMVNQSGTLQVFNAARWGRNGQPIPVVYTSSAAVYGNSNQLPLTEDMKVNPISAYGVDKLGCELHAAVAREVYQVPNIGLRLFNVYGPRQDSNNPYSGIISIFLKHIRHGRPITIYGNGLQSRDFIYVRDVIRFFIASMEILQRSQTLKNYVFNVCSGFPYTINGLVKLLAEICHLPFNIIYEKAREGDIIQSLGSNQRALAELSIKAEYTLKDGLLELIDSQGDLIK